MQLVNLNQLLDLLRVDDINRQTEEELRVGSEFATIWPGSIDTLNDYRRKRSCGTCKYRLMELFQEDPANTQKFFARVWTTGNAQLDIAGSRARAVPVRESSRSTPTLIAGEVMDIDDTPEAYAALIADLQIQRKRYTGLTVRELQPGTVRVYFF